MDFQNGKVGLFLPFFTILEVQYFGLRNFSKILNFYKNSKSQNMDIFGLRIFVEVQYDIFKILSPKNIKVHLTKVYSIGVCEPQNCPGVISHRNIYPYSKKLGFFENRKVLQFWNCQLYTDWTIFGDFIEILAKKAWFVFAKFCF